VAFVVLCDNQEAFVTRKASAGCLVPVVPGHALEAGRNTWAPSLPLAGTLEITICCFDDTDPVRQASFQKRKVSVILDLGGEETNCGRLSPKISLKLPGGVRQEELQGVDWGNRKSCCGNNRISTTDTSGGGFNTVFRPAQVLLKKTVAVSQWYDGRLGMDLLDQANAVTIDFRSMRLILE
jgi:hypothetical protein